MKFDQLNRMAAESYKTNYEDLANIDNANSLTKLYRSILGDQEIKRDKHQRNLRILSETTSITRQAADRIHETLDKLGHFQTYIGQLKRAVSGMDAARKDPVDIHRERLNDIIEKLSMYHRRYIERQKGFNQIK